MIWLLTGMQGATRKQLGMTFLGDTKKVTPTIIGDVRMKADGLDQNRWHRFGEVENKAYVGYLRYHDQSWAPF